MHLRIIIFIQWCDGTSLLKTWTFIKALLSVGNCQRHCSPGAPQLQPRGARPGLKAAAGYTTRTEVGMSQRTGGQDSSQVSWHRVLGHTAPIALLSVDGG